MAKTVPVRRPPLVNPTALLLTSCALLLGLWLGSHLAKPEVFHPGSSAAMQVYFSPNGGATHALAHLINHATKSVWVEAYSFTSRPLIRALVRAHQRGLDVEIILDKSHLLKKNYRTRRYTRHPSPALKAFYTAGIPTYIDARYLIAHNKVMLIDGRIVCTGSFNFSYAAAKFNAENMLVLRNVPGIFKLYQANFEFHEKTSQRYHPGLVLRHVFHWSDRSRVVNLK